MRQKRRNDPIIVALALLACVLLIQAPGVALCDDTVKPEAEPYAYDAEGKPDPFEPFIDINKKKEEEKEKKKEETVKEAAAVTKPKNLRFLPPLQRYGIEEFKLVAIGGSGRKKIAIVEDSKGKSFTLNKSTKIGMNEGKVIKILDDSVIIHEKVRDAQGKVTTSSFILKFTKEKVEENK